ncbi:MAG: hypothetical protein K2N52_04410, partial [Clostridia bacterium]|nr:hypothetical protein [Clostridia bacterium]
MPAVRNTILGTHSTKYGYSAQVNLPEYKTAADLFALNDSHNIVLKLNNQEFAVSFLTTDMNGHVIATLWMTQPLKNGSTIVTDKYGWATTVYNSSYTSTIGESYISNAYSTSLLRMKLLNAGPTNGDETAYATGTSNANATSLSGKVLKEDRLANILAPFTLDNNTLSSSTAYKNKSLIDFIVTPSQLEYTYWLDFCYASGSNASSSYLLNEALTSTMNLSTDVGSSNTNFFTANNGVNNGYWWNQGVLNYAISTANHYNDWGADYIWLPSLSETGYSAADGLWGTGKTTTGQIRFNNENVSDGSTLAGTTVSTDRVWLRSGHYLSPGSARILSSNATSVVAYTTASLAVRPALHLDLTLAEEACAVGLPDEEQAMYTYSGSELDILDYIYNTNRISFTSVTGKNFDGTEIDVSTADVSNNIFKPTLAGIYTLNLVIKNINDLDWADGKTKAESQTLIITVNKATPDIDIADPAGDLYVSSVPNINELFLSAKNPVSGIAVDGTITWNDLNPIEGTDDYSWSFLPNDTDNYNEVTGEKTLTFIGVELEKIEAGFDNSVEITTDSSLDDLIQYLTITGTYVDGNERQITSGFNLNGVLSVAGTATITVTYIDPATDKEFKTTFNVNVVEASEEQPDDDPIGGGTTDPTDPDNPGGSGTTDPDNPGGTDTDDPNDPNRGGNDGNNGNDTDNEGDDNNPDADDFTGGGTTDTDGKTESDNKNGIVAVWNNLKEVMSKPFLGLPLWSWLLIGLALFILMIIIIVAVAKRKKKEEPAEKVVETVVKEITPQPKVVGAPSLTAAQQASPVSQVQQPMPVYGQGADNTALL